PAPAPAPPVEDAVASEADAAVVPPAPNSPASGEAPPDPYLRVEQALAIILKSEPEPGPPPDGSSGRETGGPSGAPEA
ncbi:MAG: DUF2147 domain-containing protein, partial [Myxococcota bacterium]|nr:DUF2147 domain-containing protein [Myxococcota bacterium]